jgi:hypothetical protein
MQTVRRWGALAAIACSLLLAALLAHSLREAIELGHEHVAQGALAVCFVFATLLAPLALSVAPPRERPREAVPNLHPEGTYLLAPIPRRARASPAWLQRFRN